MIQISSLHSLENIQPYYYINDNFEIINIETGYTKNIWINKRGYPTVSLETVGCNSRHKNVPLHKIVALAFISNRKHYSLIEHLDDDKLNYNPNNLIFSNHSLNGKRAITNKKRKIKESKFFIKTYDGREALGTMKELSIKLHIAKGTLYDNYYTRRSSSIISYIEKIS